MPKKQEDSATHPPLKEQMEALAHIVEKLEDPDVDLEESLALYEQGMALVATAGKVLEAAEQRVAMVTGDGEVQAIGGVNEKIEGFFDICQSRGLTGKQGVLIPASNVDYLMLRRDVVEAANAGMFRVLPIKTIDQGIEVLTGTAAGRRRRGGNFPATSINGLVEAQLHAFAETRRNFGSQDHKGPEAEAS